MRLWLLNRGRRDTATLTAQAYPLDLAPELAWQRLGLEPVLMDQATARLYGARAGSALMVGRVRSGSRADRAGLQHGDLILRVGREKVSEPKEFYMRLVRQRHQPEVAVLFQRGRARQVITFGR